MEPLWGNNFSYRKPKYLDLRFLNRSWHLIFLILSRYTVDTLLKSERKLYFLVIIVLNCKDCAENRQILCAFAHLCTNNIQAKFVDYNPKIANVRRSRKTTIFLEFCLYSYKKIRINALRVFENAEIMTYIYVALHEEIRLSSQWEKQDYQITFSIVF